MAAGRYNIEIEQGADWARTMSLTFEENATRSLTGYSFTGQLRTEKSDTTALASFNISITNAAERVIHVSLTNVTTSELPVGTAYYDIEMTYPDTTKIRFMEGIANISAEVTR